MHTFIPAIILLLSLSPAAAQSKSDVTIGPLAQSFYPAEDDDRPKLFLPIEGDSDSSNFEPREGDSDPSNFEPVNGDSNPDNFESPDLDELALPTRTSGRALI